MNIYDGRFDKELDELAREFNSSITFDKELYKVDIIGSIAHAKMLSEVGIIEKSEYEAIEKNLNEIKSDIESSKLKIDEKAEDIHMFIESELTNRIGNIGKKLHTARSRNDQVALDIKLYSREKIKEICKSLKELIKTLMDISLEHLDTIMPGYTHLQIAQPITFSHYLMAYAQMFLRDISRFVATSDRMNFSPLGAGALATTTYPINRQLVSDLLEFNAPTTNSIDSVSDRDHILEILFNISTIMMHLSRLSEEIIIFSSYEFKFITIDDSYSSGSSIMPQKKNPDMAELIRGKAGKSFGNLQGLFTTLKGIPLSYNKDLQEDKLYLFQSIKEVLMCLKISKEMIRTMKINKEKMLEDAHNGYINATDVADYLVRKSLSFRDAYKITGAIVKYAISVNKSLNELSLLEYKKFSDKFEDDIYMYIDLKYIVENRNVFGGPNRQRVLEQINITKSKLKEFNI